MEKQIYKYRGHVKIGLNYFLSYSARGFFGHIDFIQDRIIIYAWPFKKSIPYSKINKLVWDHFGYIKIEHKSGGAPYVAFRMFGKNHPELNKIIKILNNKNVYWEHSKDK